MKNPEEVLEPWLANPYALNEAGLADDRVVGLYAMMERDRASAADMIELALLDENPCDDSSDRRWRDALLCEVASVQFTDLAQRARFAASLLRHARDIAAEHDEPRVSERAMFAALHRYATIIAETPESVAAIVGFLTPDASPRMLSCVLQAVETLLSRKPSAAVREEDRAAIEAFALRELERFDSESSPSRVGLARVLCAATLVGASYVCLGQLLVAVCEHASVAWIAFRHLEPIELAWTESARVGAHVEALMALRWVVARLRESAGRDGV